MFALIEIFIGLIIGAWFRSFGRSTERLRQRQSLSATRAMRRDGGRRNAIFEKTTTLRKGPLGNIINAMGGSNGPPARAQLFRTGTG
jgi:hypothetical protein